MVEIRLVAASPEALLGAVERLQAVGVELLGELWEDEQGGWQVYAMLLVEVE
jgi:hypothetical protein